jgi:hypothetical protein
MPHYSFTIPSDWTGWTVKKEGGPFEKVTLAQKLSGTPSVLYNVLLMRQTVLDATVRAMPAKEVADDYSQREEGTMIFEGVLKGRYQLHDVVRTEESLDGRTAYIMRYRTDTGPLCQKAGMYLLFPKESNNDWFIVAHYTLATTPQKGVISNPCNWGEGEDIVANQFVDMLKGLRMH